MIAYRRDMCKRKKRYISLILDPVQTSQSKNRSVENVECVAFKKARDYNGGVEGTSGLRGVVSGKGKQTKTIGLTANHAFVGWELRDEANRTSKIRKYHVITWDNTGGAKGDGVATGGGALRGQEKVRVRLFWGTLS